MTNDVVEIIAQAMRDHTWSSTAPVEVFEGSIPERFEFPLVGVLIPDGVFDDYDMDDALMQDEVAVTFATTIELGEGGRKKALDELGPMARELTFMAINNPSWGDSKIQSTIPQRWESNMGTFEEDADEDSTFWLYLTVRLTVRHKMALV